MIGAAAVTVMLGRDQSQRRKVLVPGAGTSTFVARVGAIDMVVSRGELVRLGRSNLEFHASIACAGACMLWNGDPSCLFLRQCRAVVWM